MRSKKKLQHSFLAKGLTFIGALFLSKVGFSFDHSSDHLEKRLKLEKKIRSSSFKNCNKIFDHFVESRARDARALCQLSSRSLASKDAKSTIKRLKKLKKRVHNKWVSDRHLEEKAFLLSRPPHEQRELSYALLVQHLFSQYAAQCDRFNSAFSDALILINQVFPQCQKNIRFEAYRHQWRSNILQNRVYKKISEGDAVDHSPNSPLLRAPASPLQK